MPSYGDKLTHRNCDLAQGICQDVEDRVGCLRVQSPYLCAPWQTKQDLPENRGNKEKLASAILIDVAGR